MSKRILVPLAEGFEEIEAVTIIDILRRAGAEVITAGLEKRNVTGSHGIKLVADSVIAEETGKTWDAIVLPGGVPGTPNLAQNQALISLLEKTAARGRITAAVCAAPFVLEKSGLTRNRQYTSHPGWAEKMSAGTHTGQRVVIDGKLITGQAAGSAMEFAFRIVEQLFGPEKAVEINQSVLAELSE
ncbi:MAG: DJ-1 family glyoxalase III [Fidelibacterota bacterium]